MYSWAKYSHYQLRLRPEWDTDNHRSRRQTSRDKKIWKFVYNFQTCCFSPEPRRHSDSLQQIWVIVPIILSECFHFEPLNLIDNLFITYYSLPCQNMQMRLESLSPLQSYPFLISAISVKHILLFSRSRLNYLRPKTHIWVWVSTLNCRGK